MQPPPSSCGTLADVPRIVVSADDDNFIRPLASANLADHVRRLGVRLEMRRHRQLDGDVPAHSHPIQAIRVFRRHGGRGNLRCVVGILEGAGVRQPESVEPDGSNQHADGTVRRRPGWAYERNWTVVPLSTYGTLKKTMRPRASAAWASSSSNAWTTRISAWMPRANRDAVPEAEHRDGVMRRLHDLGTFGSTHPPGNHRLLGVHIFQTVRLHFSHGPLDRAIESGCAAEPVADRICQYGEAAPGERVAHRLADQSCGRLAVRVEPRGSRIGGVPAEEDKEGDKEVVATSATRAVTKPRRIKTVGTRTVIPPRVSLPEPAV